MTTAALAEIPFEEVEQIINRAFMLQPSNDRTLARLLIVGLLCGPDRERA